jgi:hypothetical protein
MIITLINPSPSRGKRFKIHSNKGRKMARLTVAQKRILKSLKTKKTMASISRDLNRWAKHRGGVVPRKKGKGTRMARKAKRRKSAKRYTFLRRTHKVRRGSHRPVVIWTGRKFRRPKRSRIFKRPTRINPRRSRRHAYRRNPLRLPMGIDRKLMAGLPIAGGIAISMFAMPQLVKYIPATMQKYSKFFGVAHIALGIAAMTLVKKDVAKTIGGTMVAMGIYDLIASNVPQLNLPQLPRGVAAVGSSYGTDEIVGTSFNEIGTDFTPVGSSYGEVGDDIDYGGDSIEIG